MELKNEIPSILQTENQFLIQAERQCFT